MRYALRTLAIAALLAAAPLAAQPSAEAVAFWTWRSGRQPADFVSIELIRGDVRIVRREGPIEVEVRRRLDWGRAAEVRILLADRGDVVVLWDRYPMPVAHLRAECLPPVGDHGDFWTTGVRFTVVIRAPRSTRIAATVLDGRVEEER